MSAEYDFHERLFWSQGRAISGTAEKILLDNIPGAVSVAKSTDVEDRSGTDWWVCLENGKRVSVDLKAREKDCQTFGNDDLALEILSVVEADKIGWTADANKMTDFILWLWEDTGRWTLVSFCQLCAVFRDHYGEWTDGRYTIPPDQYTPPKNGRSGWHSRCVFVPRKAVWRAIYEQFGGHTAPRQQSLF